jgi:hypothetical protein
MEVTNEIPTLATGLNFFNYSTLVSPSIEEATALSQSEMIIPCADQPSLDAPSKKRKTPATKAAASSTTSTKKKTRKEVTTSPLTSSQSNAFMVSISVPMSTLKASGPVAAETEFKSQAHAAVTDFLEKNQKEKPKSAEVIDTSTAHVKALACDNWVAACAELGDIEVNEPKSPGRSPRRADLTSDERAKQNRDRNREHARNTRLRKKAYVDELKKTLMEVVTQRDALAVLNKQEEDRDEEQREVRYRVVQQFLQLRGHNQVDPAHWRAILDDSFTMTLPCTSFREMVGTEIEDKRMLRGVEQCTEDAANLSTFLQTLGENVRLQYKCDRRVFMMDGNAAALDWEATTVGASHSEFTFQGFVRCTFSPLTNKLLSMNLSFDSGVVALKIGSVAVTVGSAASTTSCSKEDSSDEEEISNMGNGRVPSTIELTSPELRQRG